MAFYKCHMCGDLHTDNNETLCEACIKVRESFGDAFLAWIDRLIDNRANERAEEVVNEHVSHLHDTEDY